MVDSYVAQRISLFVDSPRSGGDRAVSAPTKNHIISIQITWGRTSLFQAPAKRSCLIDTLVSRHSVHMAGRHWPGSEITIRFDSNQMFRGHVVSFTPQRFNNVYYRVKIQCQETYGALPLLATQITTNARNIRFLESTLNAQAGNVAKPDVNDRASLTQEFDRAGQTNQTISLFDAYGGLVSSRPLAFAQWSPDYTSVSPTIYKPINHVFFNIDPKLLISPLFSYSLTHQPSHYTLSSGGTFGRKRQMAQGLTKLGGGKAKTNVEVNAPFACTSWSQSDLTAAENLINMQVFAPHKFTIVDTKIPPALYSLFYTEELTDLAWKPHNWSSNETGNQPTFHTIGGVITITPKSSKHEMTCIIAG